MAKKATGSEPTRLKVEGDWKTSVKDALGKGRPEGGWPKPESMPQRAPKKPKKKQED